ncbi:hypothetical protein Q6322_28640, partial [Klebsiella pneumoniae]|uniref:hypothetical protein n=1 Tax=Klebsiella pneumoniae TaxID=573 RepID=UPI0027305586
SAKVDEHRALMLCRLRSFSRSLQLCKAIEKSKEKKVTGRPADSRVKPRFCLATPKSPTLALCKKKIPHHIKLARE